MEKVKRGILCSLLIALLASKLTAQTPSKAQEIVQGQISLGTPATTLLNKWADLYHAGKWADLQANVKATLQEVNDKDGQSVYSFDYSQHYVIVFTSTLREPEGEEIRVLVHEPDPEDYTKRIPGLESLNEVFLSSSRSASLASSYASTRVANPILDKLPAFVKQFDPAKLANLTAAFASSQLLYVMVSRVDLPFRRATISIKDKITIPKDPNISEMRTGLDKIMRQRDLNSSPCIKALANKAKASIKIALDSDDENLKADERWNKLKNSVPDLSLHATDLVECSAGASSITERAVESQIISNMETALKNLVTQPKATEVKAEFSYENQPGERLGLGVITSLMLSISDDARVKIDDGKIASDPLSGALNLAVLNIHPISYDPKSFKPTIGERWRVFVGASFSPEFGIATGTGFSLVRGVSVNAGYALLRVDTLRRGDAIGSPPTRNRDPLKNGTSGVLFLGFGYNF